MALPRLNDSPTYALTIPSTGQSVTFRPFLVKEQKNLLIALETQDRKGLLRAIVKTIHSCVEQPLENELSTFDVDYVFTNIRVKSVGESTKIVLPCSACSESNEVDVDLSDVKVEGDIKPTLIKVTKDVSVKMRFPTYQELVDNPNMLEGTSVTESLIELLIVCMDSIQTEEERFSVKDESREEIINFIESMSPDQFTKLADFVNNIPSVQKNIDYKCTSCGETSNRVLKGMDDFF